MLITHARFQSRRYSRPYLAVRVPEILAMHTDCQALTGRYWILLRKRLVHASFKFRALPPLGFLKAAATLWIRFPETCASVSEDTGGETMPA